MNKITTIFLAAAVSAQAITAQAGKVSQMNDLEIAHTAYTAGVLDIRYAHLALALSEDATVREFAQTMLRDHQAVNDAAGSLIGALNVTPQDNDPTPHTATGSDKSWDTGQLDKGQTGAVRFDTGIETGGVQEYSCRFHPSMTGKITIAS